MTTKKPETAKPAAPKARAKSPAAPAKKSGRGGARPGAGKPPFKPTEKERAQVETLAGFGLPIRQIAALIRDGVAADTVLKYFGPELERGKAKASAKVAQTLFQKALGGDTTAMIWWTKSQMKWSERVEVTGADGAAVRTEVEKLPARVEEALERVLGLF